MTRAIAGLHHVTAISGPAQACVDFHAGVLGLRLVKRTVNFDDPGTWHLYFGDASGAPGTLLTFFPWADAPRGRPGSGETAEVALAVPAGSLDWWARRLAAHGASALARATRFGEEALTFAAPDGLALALVATGDPSAGEPWTGGGVPRERAVRALHSVTLALADPAPTAALLAGVMGLAAAGAEGGRARFSAASATAPHVDLLARPGAHALLGAGSVHHIAWRVADDTDQAAWSAALAASGRHLTRVADRCYFRSVYFREPGGVLFELATDGPGFAVDELDAALGSALVLPPWLEGQRPWIAGALPPLRGPVAIEVG